MKPAGLADLERAEGGGLLRVPARRDTHCAATCAMRTHRAMIAALALFYCIAVAASCVQDVDGADLADSSHQAVEDVRGSAHYALDGLVPPDYDDETMANIVDCSAAIGLAVAGVGLPAIKLRRFVKAAGGVRAAAARLVNAGTYERKTEIILEAIQSGAAEILGIKEIRENC
jgi:hypothetical protein